MNEVKKITIQTRAPTGRDPRAVEEGYYCVADGFVVLTDADGKPIIGEPNGQSPLTGPGAVPGGALAYTLGAGAPLLSASGIASA